jgi:hypothetical protein
MAISAARLLANRKNAMRSTGPKTSEGKAKSRQNSFKHGLTGHGVVVPPEQAAEVARRIETLEEDLQPSGEAGRILLRRFAFLSVRLEKCEEFEMTVTAKHVRHAVEVFDDNRLTEVECLVMQLPADPMTMARRLQYSPEGIDWLIGHWGELREDLMIRDRPAWTLNHWSRFEQCLGRPGGNVRLSRPYALSQAVSGYFAYLEAGDGEGLSDPERIEWARNELASIMDVEVARLKEVKAKLNPKLIEQDRLEAPGRALFDPSPEMNLARKYEASTERAMYKALNQFYEVELAALESDPAIATDVKPDTCDAELGSLFPGSDLGLDPIIEPPGSAPVSVYLRENGASSLHLPVAKPSNHVAITVGRAAHEVA